MRARRRSCWRKMASSPTKRCWYWRSSGMVHLSCHLYDQKNVFCPAEPICQGTMQYSNTRQVQLVINQGRLFGTSKPKKDQNTKCVVRSCEGL